MDFDKYLHNGIKLLKKGDYLEAINSFEEYISHNNSDYLSYYYLGLAYIFRELYDEAYKYVLKAYKLYEMDLNVINAIAFLNLKFNNVQEAINYWLDALDIDKKNYIIKRNLNKVREAKNINTLVANASPDDFISFKVRSNLKIGLPTFSLFNYKLSNRAIIVLIILAVCIGCIWLFKSHNFFKDQKIVKIDIETIDLPDIDSDYIVDKTITKSIVKFTPRNLEQLFYDTKVLIKDKKLNTAMININKVLHSNASLVIKERFKILSQFIIPIESFTLRDNVPYSELMNLPLLYEGVQVIWEGKIEDLAIKQEKQTFNLIVKEKNKAIGVAKVLFNNVAYNLENGMEVIVSGKFLKIDEENRYPVLDGIGIKKIRI